jgi:hypothetical protein
MGKTVPTYGMALEWEIAQWKGFAKALSPMQREAFEAMMDYARSNAMAGGAACNPVLFEPMVMSILLGQREKLDELEEEINLIVAKRQGSKVTETAKP